MSSAELFVIACDYVSGFECVRVHRYNNIPYYLFLLKLNSRQSQIGIRPLPKCHQQFITSCPTGLLKKKKYIYKQKEEEKISTNHFLTMLYFDTLHTSTTGNQFIPITIDGSLR